jgi:Lar family restriction alleviation protein
MELKVGDRVNVYASFMSNEPLRGTIVENCASQKDTILLKIRFDNFRGISSHEEWIHAQQCRKLVKKRKFKVGDRVRFKVGEDYIAGDVNQFLINNEIEIIAYQDSFIRRLYIVDMNQIELVKEKNYKDSSHFKCGDRVIFKLNGEKLKGRIYTIDSDSHLLYIKPDNIEDIHPAFSHRVKKLVKKKTEFKVGDRVSCRLGNKSNIEGYQYKEYKGNILAIKDNDYIKIEFDDINHVDFINPIHIKKLRKKKVKFSVGDRVIFKQSNCNSEDLKGYDNVKGTITQIRSHGDTVIALVPQLCGFINVKHLKKLVKKKKVEDKSNIRDKVKELHELGRRWEGAIDLLKMAKEFCSKKKESQETKLLPCPFCGSLECYLTLRNLLTNCLASIKCSKCGSSSGEIDNEENAIKNWNSRSYP